MDRDTMVIELLNLIDSLSRLMKQIGAYPSDDLQRKVRAQLVKAESELAIAYAMTDTPSGENGHA